MIEKIELLIYKILGSLSYKIENELKKSIYKNETYLDNKWNIIEKFIVFWTKKPFTLIVIFFIEFISISLIIYFSYSIIKKSSFSLGQSWEELVNWQSNFLSTQITIVALIFPLVIGFIGFLIQNKSSQRALWQIYMNYSGVRLLGYSSIVLSIIIILLQIAHPFLQYQMKVSFSIGIVFWLIINILLLLWFIHSTFKFISTKDRSTVILRYCINEILVHEIKYRLANLLPNTIFKDTLDDKDKPKVCTFFLSEKYDDNYTIKYDEFRYVYNIHLNILKIVEYIWKFRNKNFKGKVPILYFPVSGVYKAKEFKLALSENSNINFIERYLIKKAYSIKKYPNFEDSIFDSVIHALFSNVEDSLKEKDERLFEISMDELAFWYSQILKAASFKNENENIDNWVLLPDSKIFGETIIDSFSREFYKINKKTVSLLGESNLYFRRIVYFNLRVLGFRNKFLPEVCVNKLMENQYYSWSLLMKSKLDINIKQEIVYIYIGAWESWLSSTKIDYKNEENIEYLISVYINHLQLTVKHTFNALVNKDNQNMLYATDMLIYWYHKAFSSFQKNRVSYKWKTSLLLPSYLKNNFSSEYLNVDRFKKFVFIEDLDDSKTALVISFENLWKQTCILLAIYIFYKNKNNLSDNLKLVITSLLYQNRIYTNDMRYTNSQSNNIEPFLILESYLFNCYPLINIINTGNFAYVLEQLERMEKDSIISGRVHTIRAIDISLLLETIKIFLIGNSNKIWTFSHSFKIFCESNIFEFEARESLIYEIEKLLITPEEEVKLFDNIKTLCGEDDLKEKISNYKKSIEDILSSLKLNHERLLTISQIDKNKLESINDYCSTELEKMFQNLPFNLFNKQSFNKLKEEYKFNFKEQFGKHYLVKNLNFIDINKRYEELLNNLSFNINQKIVSSIYSNILINLEIEKETIYTNIESLLKAVYSDAQKLVSLNLTPIIFLSSKNIKWSLEDELYEKNFESIDVNKHDNSEENYICHIDNIETYELLTNENFMLLCAIEMFDDVIFHEFKEKVYLNMKYDIGLNSFDIDFGLNVKLKKTDLYVYKLEN